MLRVLFTLWLIFVSNFCFADKFSADASYKVCFTPNQACTDLITSTIAGAKKEVLVQAYSFTSAPIAKALVLAYKRGVNVKIILDKSQFKPRGFSSAKYFADYHIPLLVDYKPRIAHNKVMIIDRKIVVTGSFNFTRAAQERNTENVLIISDANLAKSYSVNWEQRAKQSELPILPPSPFENR